MSYVNDYRDSREWLRKRALEVIDKFEEDTNIDKNGVVRWKTNNSVPPSDILELWKITGKPFNYELSLAAKDKDDAKFFASYRKQQQNRVISPEEQYEMQAAFGPNATVVDIITGKVLQKGKQPTLTELSDDIIKTMHLLKRVDSPDMRNNAKTVYAQYRKLGGKRDWTWFVEQVAKRK